MMQALLAGAPADVAAALHSADDPDSLRSCLGQLISSCDVVVAAGGVSMGTRDYVPGVLDELGVELAFRRVAQKPGKPLTFGRAADGTCVFGMPGNPVSVLVSMEEYLVPALRRAAGHSACRKHDLTGRAGFEHRRKPGRDELLRVRAVRGAKGWELELPGSSGSGDLMSTADTNALAVVGGDLLKVTPGCGLTFHLHSFHAGEAAFR
jgi:molybdopterin molybdotransferase